MGSEAGGDLVKYLTENTEQLTQGNYNEVDGMIFASITYAKYESDKVTWTSTELENGISLQDFAKKMLDCNKSGGKVLSNDEEALFSAIADNPRYSNCTVSDLAACDGTTMWDAGRQTEIRDDAQWGAMTINLNDGSNSSVIAMRGTNGTQLGWDEDFELGYESEGTTAIQLSKQYLEASDAKHIYLTGHSKGGNDASSAYMMSDKSVRDRVVRVDNYDGPGHNYEFIENYEEGYAELSEKQHNYYPHDCVIGLLLKNNPGSSKFIYSNTTGHDQPAILGEHSPYCWHLSDNLDEGFKDYPQSMISKAIDRALDSALSGLSNKERMRVIRAMIDLGIPAMISDEEYDGKEIVIDASSWNSILTSIMSYKVTSLEEMWALLKFEYCLIKELIFMGAAEIVGFVFPEFTEFCYWIKDFFADVFRKFKNFVETAWDTIWNAVGDIYDHITGNTNRNEAKKKDKPIYDFKGRNKGPYTNNVNCDAAFYVNVNQIKESVDKLYHVAKIITNIGSEMSAVETGIIKTINVFPIGEIRALANRIDASGKAIKKMKISLNEICKTYTRSEQSIIEHIK